MTPHFLWFPLLCHCIKSVCDFISIKSLPWHLVSCNAVMASLYSFNRESTDRSAPFLNNIRKFHVPKVNSFSSQPGRRLFVKPVRGISECFWTQFFFPGWVCYPQIQPPTWMTMVSLFVWVIIVDRSGLSDLVSSYATAGFVLRIIWPLRPYYYAKVGTLLEANVFISQGKIRPQIYWWSGRFISEDIWR